MTASSSGSPQDWPRIMYQGSSARGGGFNFGNIFKACGLGGLMLSTNSHALPTIWRAPDGLAPFWKSLTGRNWCVPTLAREGSCSLPQGKVRPSAPRAAFSHSCELGMGLPAHAAKARASSMVTLTTGKAGWSVGKRSGSGRLVAWQNLAYSAFGTSVRSRSEEHTSELQSLRHLVCRLL